MFVNTRVLLVTLGNSTPLLRHKNVNGPEPDTTVLKVTELPGQLVAFNKGVSTGCSLTVKVAKFVTLLHSPVTSTEYTPPSSTVTLLRASEVLVWPGISAPSFRQRMANGPVPSMTVEN